MSTQIKRTFDRVHIPDPKDADYPMRYALPLAAKRQSRSWDCYVQLNQGSEGSCVGYGISHELASDPVIVPGINNGFARILYLEAQREDEYPGEDYKGSSIRGGMKASTKRGYYGGYRWTNSEKDVALAVGHKGPVILGVAVYTGMMETDGFGFVHLTGVVEGLHCILCIEYRHAFIPWLRRYRLKNSWGPLWGIHGSCWMWAADLKRMLKRADCTACLPTVRKLGHTEEGRSRRAAT
jgi:hypothetical protein